MISGRQLKICGLTDPADAAAAAASGADWLGFILHPGSPRRIALADYVAAADRWPALPRVAVAVEPSPDEVRAMRAAGFDRFQIHFRHDRPVAELAAWAEIVGPDRLWLAPKLPPEVEVAPAWLPLAGTFLLDTFHAGFGGSGLTGDWVKFARHRRAHTGHGWILAGGLTADNVAEAVRQSGATWIDANSGVEASPGRKDPGKLAAFAGALRALPRVPAADPPGA
jgi:phosphoribosylanthranilate isomerase